MNLSLFTRLFNWRKLRLSPTPTILRPSLATTALTVNQSGSVDVILSVPRNRYTGTITPSVSVLPSGTTASFSPATLNASTLATTMTLTATGGATTVTNQAFTVLCQGTGVNDATTSGTVTVAATVTPSISVALTSGALSALQGQTAADIVTITRTNYTGDVTLAITGLPTGGATSTGVFSPNPLTGGTLAAGLVVTVPVAANTVTNDAFTVTASGTGVSNSTANGTLTITSPGATRGVPSADFVKGDQFSYANTAALRAVITTGTGSSSGLMQYYSALNDSLIELSSDITFEGHNVMRYPILTSAASPPRLQMAFAGVSGHPTAKRAGGSFSSFTNCAAYVVMAYSPGFTTAGSGATSNAYKFSALGVANANGRCGPEWSSTSNLVHTVGWNSTSNNSIKVNGQLGSDTLTFNGDARPYSVTGASGTWTAGLQWVCHYWECNTVDVDTVRYRHWTWLYGSTPTVNPQFDHTRLRSAGSSLNTFNRLALGENFNQAPADRYAPSPSYIYWGDVRIYDLDYVANPLNLY